MTDPSIPTIRLDDPDEAATVASLRSACVDVGFFYLEGHGISPEFLDSVMAQSKALFDLPLKEKLALQDPILNRGYTGMEEETLDRDMFMNVMEHGYLPGLPLTNSNAMNKPTSDDNNRSVPPNATPSEGESTNQLGAAPA